MGHRNEWIIKTDPNYESTVKGYSKKISKDLNNVIQKLKNDPYIGKNLGPQRPSLWEIYIGDPARFRLYYEIWESKKIVYLKAVYPRNLQKKFLNGRI